MAQRAEILNTETLNAEVLNVEAPGLQLAPATQERIEERPRAKLADVTQTVIATYRSAKARAAQSCSAMAQKCTALGTSISRRIQRTRSERPLQIVAIAAGAGFVAGVL